MIQVAHLRKAFGPVVAVDGMTFGAPDGSITGILGPNGAGKTTTLAIIAGVLMPNAGRVMVDGVDQAPGGRSRRIAAVLDQRGLYPRLTVRENVEYFGRLQGVAPGALSARASRLIEGLRLERIAGQRAAGLSEGERMKVALARALVHAPRHLILDEPTNGLDVPAVRSLRDTLRGMRDEGLSVVFSSHSLAEVRELCDRVVIVASGRVMAEGPMDEIAAAGGGSLEDAYLALTTEAVPS